VVRPARASARRRVRFIEYQGVAGDKAGNGTELRRMGLVKCLVRYTESRLSRASPLPHLDL